MTFYEKELQKTNQTEFKVEKQSRDKAIKYILNGRTTIIISTVELIKEI